MDCACLKEIFNTTKLDPRRRQMLIFFEEGADEHLRDCPRCATHYSLAILQDAKSSGEYTEAEVEEKRSAFQSMLTENGLLDEAAWKGTES